ncbi:transglutaminase-like domain-containing protein [Syntrophomonas curvata]
MQLVPEADNIDPYLESSDVIDFFNPNIQIVAEDLRRGSNDEINLARSCYEWVRDNIYHSFDIDGTTVACTASEVLQHKEGICYAKSHLLAAILRYLGIPAGFCYQKLVLDDSDMSRLVIHGLNAIYIKSLNRWIRVDARGNNEEVHAEFSTEEEKLAFPVRKDLGEIDYPIIYLQPHPRVVHALKASKTIEELRTNLPEDL